MIHLCCIKLDLCIYVEIIWTRLLFITFLLFELYYNIFVHWIVVLIWSKFGYV